MTGFKKPLDNKTNTLSVLKARIVQQKKLLRLVQAALPPELAAQARHCLIKNTVLLIYCDSSAWAANLRFCSPLILQALKNIAPSVDKIEVRLISQVINTNQTQVIRQAKLPTASMIETLRKDSLAIADEELKNALLHLSATLAKKRAAIE
jgi:hypothetical protein